MSLLNCSAARSIALLSMIYLAFGTGSAIAAHSHCPTLFNSFSATDRGLALASISSAGEALPLGVNRFMNWRARGRLGLGNNAQQYSAFVPWGQVFPQAGAGAIAPAVIEIRDLRSYILSRRTLHWRLISRTNQIQGRIFLPNFEGNESDAAKVIYLSNSSLVQLNPTRPFHFWPAQGRVAIDGGDVGGVLVAFQSRMAADSLGSARYVVGAGADYWKAKNSKWLNYTTNGDAGIGRFTIPSTKWRRSFMYTGASGDLLKCVE